MRAISIEAINASAAPVQIEIGCGPRPRFTEYTSIDMLEYPNVDIVGDALSVFSKIDDNKVDTIFASHFLEHIDDLDGFLKQVVRVCVDGAKVRFEVPHFSNAFFYSDVTHKTFFGLYSFCYLAKNNVPFKRPVPEYATVQGLEQEDVRLVFKSYRPRYIRHGIRKAVQWLVNLGCYSKEFYEENLTGIVSCYELDFYLVVKKS
jgi:SAM-dependent methyltransferase